MSVLIIGCNQNLADINQEVLGDVFEELVGEDIFMTMEPPPFRPFHPDSMDWQIPDTSMDRDGLHLNSTEKFSEESERLKMLKEYESFDRNKYKEELAEYKRSLSTFKMDSSVVVLIKHSISSYGQAYPFFTNNLEFLLTAEGFSWNINPDTTWLGIFRKMVEDRGEPVSFNVESLRTGLKVQYESGYFNKESEDVAAIVSFSKVTPNSERTRAVFYYSIMCGHLCGSGELVFVKKNNGKWEVVERTTLWIS